VKLRMAENSLFAILMRKRWWVSAAVAVVLGLLGVALLPPDWRVVGALSGFPFAVIAVMSAWRGRHAPSPGRVAEVDAAVRAMPWPAFADLLEQAFRRDGHEVRRTSGGGADFELVRQGQTLLVSARRWKTARTGLEPLRELQAAREHHKADAGIYLAGGEISDKARSYAREAGLRLIDAPELLQLLHASGVLRKG
jgi:restriction system protein